MVEAERYGGVFGGLCWSVPPYKLVWAVVYLPGLNETPKDYGVSLDLLLIPC